MTAGRLPDHILLLIPVEVAFLVFHATVFLFIVAQKFKGSPQMSHAFYTIYLLQCCGNYANYGLMWLDRCIYEYKVVPLMTGALDISYYYAMTYAMFFQFFTNVAIAFNRFTAISFPARHAQIWRGKSLLFIIILVLFIPFLCASSRPVIALAAGGDWWVSWGWAEHYRIVVTVAVLVLVCLSNGSMELWTFYVYHRMNAARRRQNREEYRLLLYAMLEHFMILLRTFYFFLLATTDGSNWRLVNVAVEYMRYVVSVETFSSPVFLFSTSTVVRQGYLRFYRCTGQNSGESPTVLFSRTISVTTKA